MIDGLKPYRAMKDSGTDWLGEVPAHWDVRRLGQFGAFSKGNGGNKEDEVSTGIPCIRYGDLYTTHQHFILNSRSFVSSDVAKEYTPLRFGDVLFAASGETVDEIGKSAVNLLRSEACCGGDVILFRSKREVEPRYMGYATDCLPAAEQKATMGRGITVIHIYADQLKRLHLALPPLPEQAAIARYLDHADQRIRRYIRAKEKLIALLEEQKRAIIHEAVTGRIDVRTGKPYPAYKDSGVEWLGDVPAHWEVRRVKSLSIVKRGASPRPIGDSRYFDTNGEFAWVRIADVTASDRYLEETTQRLSPLGQSLSVELAPGALFLSIAGSVGKPIITKIKCCIHDGFVYFPQFSGNREFLYRIFSCKEPFAKLGKLGTQLNLNTDTVGAICLGWPPSTEQEDIVNFLNDATRGNELATASARREIDLLHEYRTRLIADVVTGKLDVREAVTVLPEELDFSEAVEGDDTVSLEIDEGQPERDQRAEVPTIQEELTA